MSETLSMIREELLYSAVVFDGKERIRKQIDEDNRNVGVIWSIVEGVFWVFCLSFSVSDPIFERCRPLYIVVLALTIVTLILMAFVAPRVPKIIRPTVIAMQLILICAGVGLIFFQWDARSATFVAVVLIVPVMFLTDTLPTIACVALGLVVLAVAGPSYVEPEVYSWTWKTLSMFAIAGILIGHVINKARFERYAFEESALELAELRHKYAYFDQLTGLQNRRAYTEKIEALAAGPASTYCVVSADVNELKKMNDTYGHGTGDELITAAAQCLQLCFENAGEVYRLGGDEFCVISTEPQEDVEKRLIQMDQMAANWKGKLVEGLSISYGIATTQGAADFDAVFREADRKMYENKRSYYVTSGRDRRHLPDEAEN